MLTGQCPLTDCCLERPKKKRRRRPPSYFVRGTTVACPFSACIWSGIEQVRRAKQPRARDRDSSYEHTHSKAADSAAAEERLLSTTYIVACSSSHHHHHQALRPNSATTLLLRRQHDGQGGTSGVLGLDSPRTGLRDCVG